jgi:tRNA threonylcarbamoyladenosine biosynthesis protein TsaE
MSIADNCTLEALEAENMRFIGSSLAQTLYRKPLLITLSGELGVGKTTFAQGFAEGLGIADRVVSPTFSLEQRYGDVLSHIDLYRLKKSELSAILHHTEEFPGIRLMEWGDRARHLPLKEDIRVVITDHEKHGRLITVEFLDLPIPSNREIENWCREVVLPDHIVDHMNIVARVADIFAEHLVKRGMVVRRKALAAAAKSHDLMRFVDFRENGTHNRNATEQQTTAWSVLKKKYAEKHEGAACEFLADHHYSEIGKIIRTHRGYPDNELGRPQTTEQRILAYADKRVLYDKVVTLEQRFHDFAERYAGGKTTAFAKAWYAEMQLLEQQLFPEGVPTLR